MAKTLHNNLSTSTTAEMKAAYCAKLEALRSELHRLEGGLMDATGNGDLSDNINWGHVGDLGHALEQIREISTPRRVK